MKDELAENETPTQDTFELKPPTKEDKVEGYKELKYILEKYDIGEMVSDILNLKWKEKVVINDTDSKYGADYKLPNEAYVNYSDGTWGITGVAHEMVHLLMHQNDWTEIPKIKNYISEYKDLQDPTRMRSVGYPIEQMVAYLLMRDVALKISEKEDGINKEDVLSQYNKDWFARILNTEYPTEHLKILGNKIIEKWENRPKELPITDWVESVLD